ncbi:uncharacterized protein PHALS_06417 [Plasmopara halstedii]|uniref:WRKY19-like zinc finger domain-containing protein n=1 Tax=Plasmopara halstedii TaxID=4781 RepID=A0A0P1B2Y0_PLAHL|nr:uncharacterized protein PHALS_06417 [Plasmopara halstedii]CEG48604.1 hypothetical protein PHALS_06417 [Plasmopara halstedii]|eukprot:XP_024584973.1 hypothetical protein PHALS_06417 [Plasmopara halstedii]
MAPFQNLPTESKVDKLKPSDGPTMMTSQASFSVPMTGTQPFLAPAFAVPRSQQSLSEYPPLVLFAAAEQAQQQELQHQQKLAVNVRSLPPPQSSFRRPVTPSLSLNISPRLPSLEGLLKQMQTNSPTTSASPSPQHSRPAPVSRCLSPMPFQRSLISPDKKKSVYYTATMPHTPLPSVASLSMQQSGSLMGPTFSVKRRSWSDISPARNVLYSSSSHISTFGGHTTNRSRTSKYCKIDGCERVSQRNNLCHSHGGKRLCKEEGCSSKDRGNGFCIKHGGGKICSMLGCEKKARRKGLCTQHFRVSGELILAD